MTNTAALIETEMAALDESITRMETRAKTVERQRDTLLAALCQSLFTMNSLLNAGEARVLIAPDIRKSLQAASICGQAAVDACKGSAS